MREQLTELAWGLELSQQWFIMVVRKPSDYAAAAFFNVGSESDDPRTYLPDGFVERTKVTGLVVSSWAPQYSSVFIKLAMATKVSILYEITPKSHVAFLASPGMGHITPLFELAIRLVTQHDFQVSFLVITTASSPAQIKYLNANPFPELHIVDLLPADLSGLISDDMGAVTRLCLIVQESTRPLRSILSELKGPKLRALVIDIFCTGVFELCNALSIPVYSFFTASGVLFTFSLYLPSMDREGEGDQYVDLSGTVEVPGCIFVNTWDDLEPVSLNAVRHEPFFLNISTPPVHPIGPLIKQIEPVVTEIEKEIIAWLDKQPKDSVLYVTFGSGGTLTREQLTELAWGLELSRQRFIMVVRKPSDYAAAAFFNVGSESDDPRTYLPDGFVERTKGTGLVVSSWAPQNSKLESLKHGVPMIGWPMYAEQRMNAMMLSNEVGVAVKMHVVGDKGETMVVRREEIKRVVQMVMEGEEGKKMRSRAKELEASSRATLSRGGTSYETLARVAESWKLG
ncbi:anthocyanidin 3-O-glucosyltransferase 5-like protein [Tanacetum coccineum]